VRKLTRVPPRAVVDDDALYLVDNGAVLCGAHLGSSARYTGRDISGQAIHRLNVFDLCTAKSEGWTVRCEVCGKQTK
jgi:hypothetical protein